MAERACRARTALPGEVTSDRRRLPCDLATGVAAPALPSAALHDNHGTPIRAPTQPRPKGAARPSPQKATTIPSAVKPSPGHG